MNNNIKTFDKFMDEESHKLIEKEVNTAQLRSYWSSSNKIKSSWHWHSSIFQDTAVLPVATNHDIRDISQKTPYIMNLWKEIQKKISDELDYKCDFARAYINAHTHGVDGMIHSDDGN